MSTAYYLIKRLHRNEQFWTNPSSTATKDVRLMVKRVFITSDLGDEPLPKWASFVKVVVDGMSEPRLSIQDS